MDYRFAIALLASIAPLHSQPAPWKDPSPHHTQFLTVAPNIRLEVLDWGGAGRPIVLLAGGGDTAHVFDDFAPKVTSDYHVYGITRRGFGASDFSATEYDADRLGDDVLAVIDTLKLARPVLVGHSIGGEELSSMGTRHPDRIAGLIYLDAAYSYAFDNGKVPGMQEFQGLQGPQPPEPGEADLASYGALSRWWARVYGFPLPESEFRQSWESSSDGRVTKRRDFPGGALLMAGMKKYTGIRAPVLAIFANPHSQGAWVDNNPDPNVQEAAKAYSAALSALTERQLKAFEDGVPSAHVVVLVGANHYVYLSNEGDVLREMWAFLKGLR